MVPPNSIFFLFFLLSALLLSSTAEIVPRRTFQRNKQIPSCSEMVRISQCSQNPNCKWCKSELLDDMCFSRTEAWRLPVQVFVCD